MCSTLQVWIDQPISRLQRSNKIQRPAEERRCLSSPIRVQHLTVTQMAERRCKQLSFEGIEFILTSHLISQGSNLLGDLNNSG